jgi:hypothetical protein
VYVRERSGGVFTESQYQEELRRRPEARAERWRPMRQNPTVFARGTVRHSDHRTVRLSGWHRVHMSTEHRAEAGRWVAFLD